jgi:hypothetical protein
VEEYDKMLKYHTAVLAPVNVAVTVIDAACAVRE